MGLACDHVLREMSIFVDGELDSAQKLAMEEHFAGCPNCRSVLDGMRNVVTLYGNEELVALPPGFHARLRGRMADRVEGEKGSVIGWLVAAAAFGALAASILLTTAQERFTRQPLAEMSQPARRLPEKLVAVVDGGKLFHAPGCTFMHGKYHMITAEEAIREGYSPCIHCMSQALQSSENTPFDTDEEEAALSALARR